MQLSQKVKALIAKARIVSFSQWPASYPQDAIARFQLADDERRYLTDEDCQHIERLAPPTLSWIVVAQRGARFNA